MNANELADELDDCGKFFEDRLYTKAAAMLHRLYTKAAAMLRQQQAEIEGLKKQLETSALLNYNKGHEDGRNIALPIKTLADEEIYKVYLEVEDAKCPSDDFEYMMFARAILRKASEQ